MEIVGIGTDIVDMRRVAAARFPERIAAFLFVEEELLAMRHSRDQTQFIASRLAAKEAVIKAFPGTLGYHDFSIGKRGKDLSVHFLTPSPRGYTAFVSVAHEFSFAVGYATLCHTKPA